MCDTLRGDALLDPEGRYDTPNLDRLAADGTLFPRAFTHAPMTLPAHTALFSSRPPLETTVWNNGEPVPGTLPLLSEWMLGHGYQTRAVISLATLSLGRGQPGVSRGFESYDVGFWRMVTGPAAAARARAGLEALDPGRPAFYFAHFCDPHEPYDAHGSEANEAELTLDGKTLERLPTSEATQWLHTLELAPGRHEFALRSKERFRPRWFAARAGGHELEVTWLEGERMQATRRARLALEVQGDAARRVDLELWINDVPSDAEKVVRYAREVAASDAAIGELLDELRAQGRYDAALIVFTSDHGESLGEHGHFGHVDGLTDEQIHVPLIVKLPAGDPRRARLAERAGRLTPHMDLAPTILDLVGLPPLPGARGQSLLGAHEALLISETHTPEADRTLLALRDERFKLLYFPDERRFEMYDLERDPGELTDVYAERGGERPDWPARLEGLARAGAEQKQGRAGADAALQADLEALGYGGGEDL